MEIYTFVVTWNRANSRISGEILNITWKLISKSTWLQNIYLFSLGKLRTGGAITSFQNSHWKVGLVVLMRQMKPPELGYVLDIEKNLPANKNIIRPLCQITYCPFFHCLWKTDLQNEIRCVHIWDSFLSNLCLCTHWNMVGSNIYIAQIF